MDNSWLFALMGNPIYIKILQATVFLLMLAVALRLPSPGAAGVLINPAHPYTDIYLPIKAAKKLCNY